MIHTTELNGYTNAQYNHINKDDDTQIGDMDDENMQREKEEGRKEKEVKALSDVEWRNSIYLTPIFNTIQPPSNKIMIRNVNNNYLFCIKGYLSNTTDMRTHSGPT